jgi:hypothetical protein
MKRVDFDRAHGKKATPSLRLPVRAERDGGVDIGVIDDNEDAANATAMLVEEMEE